VEQTGRGEIAKLNLTEAGEKFLSLSEDEETAFFLNQVAKVQFPSAQHSTREFAEMDCRPLTVTLTVMLEIGSLTKEEFGLFVLPCVRASMVSDSVKKLRAFREEIKKESPGLPRKIIKQQLIKDRILDIYAVDVAKGRTLLREGGSDFVSTKHSTLKDYADSSFRYLLSTGLFKIEPHGKTFSLLDSKTELANTLIRDLGVGSTFGDYNPRTYTSLYLGNPREPSMEIFSTKNQSSRLLALLEGDGYSLAQIEELKARFTNLKDGIDRENFLGMLSKDQKIEAISKQAVYLVANREKLSDEILQMFEDITSKNAELIDKPLFLEWNTWRTVTALNDAIEVVGNFRCDTDGNPLGTASGKQPDILAEYKNFWLAVEVTLMSGHKQYEAESESIVRHIGKLQAERKALNDPRPVFGLFVAPKVNETVVNYLMTTARVNSKIYGGPVKIAPLPLDGLTNFLSSNRNSKLTSSKPILDSLELFFADELLLAGDEPAWLEMIHKRFSSLSLTD
jgi:hypothetical protein